MDASTLVQKLWNCCNVLRDDGMSYGDYVEQLTDLLFLKMADERSQPPYSQPSIIPAAWAWPSLLAKDGDELFDHYRHALDELGKSTGTLGLIYRSVPVKVMDALVAHPGVHYNIMLANPPFGKKSSTQIEGADGKRTTEKDVIEREDFWATASNKQLNFVQLIKTLLKVNGRAAVVLPDNVLFEGGAGETIRRKLLHECELHTLLRLPMGLSYAQGVKANVLFFDKKPASESPWTKKLWIYDLRTNQHFTLKTNPLRREDLDEFVRLYNPANRFDRAPTWRAENPHGHWRAYEVDELMARGKAGLDIFWLRDETLADSDNLPPPDVIAQEIVDDLDAALEQFHVIAGDLGVEAAAR